MGRPCALHRNDQKQIHLKSLNPHIHTHMKKTLSINVSGIIFHIEEDGYETLRKYLDSINRYFSSFEDSSEIIADIENRIAEIFLSKLNEGKQVFGAAWWNALWPGLAIVLLVTGLTLVGEGLNEFYNPVLRTRARKALTMPPRDPVATQ